MYIYVHVTRNKAINNSSSVCDETKRLVQKGSVQIVGVATVLG